VEEGISGMILSTIYSNESVPRKNFTPNRPQEIFQGKFSARRELSKRNFPCGREAVISLGNNFSSRECP